MAPDGALARLSSAINRRPRRLLGILKTESEFVGIVNAPEFEVWERRQNAIHARGRVRGQRGGTRVEIHFVLTRRTRVLMILFFLLYAAVAYGVAARAEEPLVSPAQVVISVGGATAVALIFLASARHQEAALRSFLEGLFRDERGA